MNAMPPVFVFHLPQLLRIAHIHPAVLRLPAVERRCTDAMLPAKIRRPHSCLVLLQNPDDLLFRVPALLHPKTSRSDYERTPVSTARVFRGQDRWPLFELVGIVFL